MDGVDPYKMLHLQKNFTAEELKASYKKLIMIYHPDMKTGNEEVFKLVSSCYKKLKKKYENRVGDKQYDQLKQEFTSNKDPFQSNETIKSFSEGFNVNKFNQIFSDNRIPDIYDSGYDDWLRNNPDTSESSKIKFNKKFSRESFNDHFEQNVEKTQSKYLSKWKEPQALSTAKSIAFTELGEDALDDFSGDNKSLKNLNYMDLKLAYTTNRIIDPSTVSKRKDYENIGQLEKDRENISYTMNASERKEALRIENENKIREERRLRNLSLRDQASALQFEKINRVLLGR